MYAKMEMKRESSIDFSYICEENHFGFLSSAIVDHFREEIEATINDDEFSPNIYFSISDNGENEIVVDMPFFGQDCFFSVSLDEFAKSFRPSNGFDRLDAMDVVSALRKLADKISEMHE
jgi:hypothetical protein